MRACLIAACLAIACGDRAEVRVGSKAFTESVVLGELAAQTVRADGGAAVHRAALGGTRLLWNALGAGEIDLYPEYTGTLYAEILGETPPRAPADAIARLRRTLGARGLGVVGPLGFNNTYALGMREPEAARLGIRTLSDLARHPELRVGLSNEIMSRQDGWPSLRARYGLPHEARGLDHDVAYGGLVAGAIDVTDLYTTDAEIAQHGLRVLRDDRAHFPRYDAIFVYRLAAEAQAPRAFAALRRLSLSDEAMRALNARVKIGRETERAVAASVVGAAAPAAPGVWRRIAARGTEHLLLVAVSLAAAIAVSIPLGVVAWRRPRIGHAVLAVVGVVQTIPSLALLVVLVPLLGLGAAPAIVALFLYSLLPIVRNTHAGLAAVPSDVRESALAMGLSRGAILRHIELPLAAGAILAGIKSAAVINVGTATLGALVGAGGFGQPIFTGVRLADTRLLLEGAVPASLLALAVQGAFDGLEARLRRR